MRIVVAYMKTHPLRPWTKEMAAAVANAARHPKRLWSLRHFATASHTEFLEETFESELPKGALAAMAAFSQMRLDMTAWAMIYLGVVQKTPNLMPVGGTGSLPAAMHRYLIAHGAPCTPIVGCRSSSCPVTGSPVCVWTTTSSSPRARA